jgi:aspartyl-tRNA(Asn)/glutamyl-tRNA(Gln) amidotransferase subunit C
MRLTREEVEHIAELARLGLTEEEKERFGSQLSAILEYFQVLQRLDTESVPPTTAAIPLENIMFDDQVEPPAAREDILLNAPDPVDGFFRVRAVLE